MFWLAYDACVSVLEEHDCSFISACHFSRQPSRNVYSGETLRHLCLKPKFGKSDSPNTYSWQEEQIWAYLKNVNLPRLLSNKISSQIDLVLPSSEENGRKGREDIWNQKPCALCTRVADLVTPWPFWQ